MVISDKYEDGLNMDIFKRIDLISQYNFNYYFGFGEDLLFAKSDDDNTTEWWIISGLNNYYIGESYCNNNNKLKRYNWQQA